ncbi:MAG TPA: hypothetical protein PKN95_00105 [Verrucomicrobiota bacterium]|nr:hypothetical protein [Verrucomicrobiota bacterium]HNT15953.1 hypothetical protein [Verrucomicrobiota bacterium]
MKRIWLLISIAGMAFLGSGCSWLSDDGVHLAETLAGGAKTLEASGAAECTISFVPLNGIKQIYTVQLGANSSVVVWSRRGGSSTYHLRFVRVPTGFNLSKTNAPLQITLRKTNNAVVVAAVR